MFHDVDQNRRHYDEVTSQKQELYFQRFDTGILDDNPIVAGLLSEAFRELFPEQEGHVLDLGCGTAFYFPLLAARVESLVGVDVSGEMLLAARQLAMEKRLDNCEFIQGSALQLPFANDSFDAIHCWDFFHHVADVPRTIAEIERVLKPNGRLIATEPNLINPSITWYHLRRRHEWRLFLQNQFTIPRSLRHSFDIELRYDNTIISFLNEKTQWIWRAANALTSVWPFGVLSFRYVIDARLREQDGTHH